LRLINFGMCVQSKGINPYCKGFPTITITKIEKPQLPQSVVFLG